MSISRPVWYVVVDNRHKRAPNLSFVWSGSGEFTCGAGALRFPLYQECLPSIVRLTSPSLPGGPAVLIAHTVALCRVLTALQCVHRVPAPRGQSTTEPHISDNVRYCCVFRAVWTNTTELMLRGTSHHCGCINVTDPTHHTRIKPNFTYTIETVV